jgi:hypothetical protein
MEISRDARKLIQTPHVNNNNKNVYVYEVASINMASNNRGDHIAEGQLPLCNCSFFQFSVAEGQLPLCNCSFFQFSVPSFWKLSPFKGNMH